MTRICEAMCMVGYIAELGCMESASDDKRWNQNDCRMYARSTKRSKKRFISLAMLLACFGVYTGLESRNEIISDVSLARFLASFSRQLTRLSCTPYIPSCKYASDRKRSLSTSAPYGLDPCFLTAASITAKSFLSLKWFLEAMPPAKTSIMELVHGSSAAFDATLQCHRLADRFMPHPAGAPATHKYT